MVKKDRSSTNPIGKLWMNHVTRANKSERKRGDPKRAFHHVSMERLKRMLPKQVDTKRIYRGSILCSLKSDHTFSSSRMISLTHFKGFRCFVGHSLPATLLRFELFSHIINVGCSTLCVSFIPWWNVIQQQIWVLVCWKLVNYSWDPCNYFLLCRFTASNKCYDIRAWITP